MLAISYMVKPQATRIILLFITKISIYKTAEVCVGKMYMQNMILNLLKQEFYITECPLKELN